MGNRKVIQLYYDDINNLADLLTKLVNSYRIIIGGADDLNKIALANKGQVKEALKRADKIGNIIDDIIGTLDDTTYNYINYCDVKAQVIKCKIHAQYILNEIDEELDFKD